MRSFSLSARLWRWRAAVAEAMVLASLARFLIRFVPFKFWRPSLGRIAGSGGRPEKGDGLETALPLAKAVNRGADLLPGETICLPRAMTLQWMLARRGRPSSLVFGVSSETEIDAGRALHAWIECDGMVVLGDDADSRWHPGLTLHQGGILK